MRKIIKETEYKWTSDVFFEGASPEGGVWLVLFIVFWAIPGWFLLFFSLLSAAIFLFTAVLGAILFLLNLFGARTNFIELNTLTGNIWDSPYTLVYLGLITVAAAIMIFSISFFLTRVTEKKEEVKAVEEK
jgi:hypothetical protein